MASSRYGHEQAVHDEARLVAWRGPASCPGCAANATASSNASGEVSGERTTSTSFMSGTGLKKCRPTKRSARLVVAAISVIDSDEVLEAKIACGGAGGVEGLEDLALGVEVLDHHLDHEVAVAEVLERRSCPSSRPRTSALRSAVTLPFSTPLARKRLDLAQALLQELVVHLAHDARRSPASAQTCAMPEPIRPQPTTPTVLISIARYGAPQSSLR